MHATFITGDLSVLNISMLGSFTLNSLHFVYATVNSRGYKRHNGPVTYSLHFIDRFASSLIFDEIAEVSVATISLR